jgi:ubiquinone/menaquinone biosynthesis C-methylase UbiE
MSSKKYIPALRFKWLTPLYGFLIGITLPEAKMKRYLVGAAAINVDSTVLDFGCGTGTLAILVKESCPAAKITGIDTDVQILNKGIHKAKEKEMDILFQHYDGGKFPFPGNSFNCVISSLVFHHLDTETKQSALAEIYRVLNSGGQLHIADFGRSKSWVQRTLFNLIRLLDGFKPTESNAKGLLPKLISEAGFKNEFIQKHFKTMFGEIQVISADKN